MREQIAPIPNLRLPPIDENTPLRPLTAEEYYADTAYNSKQEKGNRIDPKSLDDKLAYGLCKLEPLQSQKHRELVSEDLLALEGDIYLRRANKNSSKVNKQASEKDLADPKEFAKIQRDANFSNSYTLLGSRGGGGKWWFISFFRLIETITWVLGLGGAMGFFIVVLPITLFVPGFQWLVAFYFLAIFQTVWLIHVPCAFITDALSTWKGEIHRFDRRTGMWIIPKGQKKSIYLPFKECAPYLQHQVNNGTASVYLCYVHLPTGHKQNLGISGLVNAYVTHAYIQHFMDTSRALPNDPSLEMHRPLDPITFTEDKAKKRNPRYWRDMPVDQFRQKIEFRKARVRKILAKEMVMDGKQI